MSASEISPSNFYGLVDMGSNGIRFSITDVTPATSRSLPVVFQERLGISLYDAQWSTGTKEPIPQDVIDQVLSGLKRFKTVCADFAVPDNSIKILATEATRNATNSVDYRNQIKDATGWDVEMLVKEDEGRIGAMGIASSFDEVEGLVMDLGGGSTQLTWMMYQNGNVSMAQNGSVSFPYGAAAMTKLLADIDGGKDPEQDRAELKAKIKQEYTNALESLDLPDSLKQKQTHEMTLYLSGGGFRGWGYILMSKAKRGPYPIPIINGFRALITDFSDTKAITETAQGGEGLFRVSKRRASQVPAVAFLVNAIIEAFPFVKDVRFSQGGVREGYLFDHLSPEAKSQSPLSSATSRFAVDADSAAKLADLLASALPANSESLDRHHPSTLTPALFRAIADTMYVQLNAPKESASLSALHLPITGVLSSAHGISHTDRALLALTLCRRWPGDLPPPHDDFAARLSALLTQQEVWWAKYLGTVAAFLGDIYPSGRVPPGDADRVRFNSEWSPCLGKNCNQHGLVLTATLRRHGIVAKHTVRDDVAAIEDMAKKKNRVGGKEYGFGLPVEVHVEWVE